MKSPELELRDRSIRFLAGEEELDDLRRTAHALGAAYRSDTEPITISRIELLLSEESSGHWDLDEFRDKLREELVTMTVSIPESGVRVFTTSSALDTLRPAAVTHLTHAGI
jgi:hypothetical protein